MRPVQEMNMEFVNALNAAESECAKLRRILEEEQKLVQRLEQEKEDEVKMANIKIERMSQQLAEARKDAEFATVRADVAESECDKLRTMLGKEQKLVQRHKLEKDDEAQAQLDKRRIEENEWIKTKRELQKERELLQLLKPEYDEIRRSAMRQVEEKELELVNLLNKNDEIRQSAMRQVEEKELELANLPNTSEIAEIEWIKVKKELQEKLEHVQLLKQECQETRQSAMRQVEEKKLEFADALNALNAAAAAASSSAAAEGECAKLKRMLILEKDLVVNLAQRQIEETCQELTNVLDVTTTTESSSTAEGFAATATSVFATPTHSQSTPFGSSASSPLFGSSGNTTISSGSSMLPFSSVADVFNSASNTCSSHSSAMSSIFGFPSRENKSSSSFPFGVSRDFVFSASSLPLLVSSTASTVSSPILVSSTASTVSSPILVPSTASAASNASSLKFDSSTSSVASTASSSKFSCSRAFIASCTSMPIIGSFSPSSSFSLGGSYSSGRKLLGSEK